MKKFLKKKKGNDRDDFARKLLDHDHMNRPGGGSVNPMLSKNNAVEIPDINRDNNARDNTNVREKEPPRKLDVEEGYKWDFCIMVPNVRDKNDRELHAKRSGKFSYEDIMERLHLANLQTYSFVSNDGEEILIKIRAPLDVLEARAMEIEYPLMLDPEHCKYHIDNQQQLICDDPDITHITPYQYIYVPYNAEKREMFANAHGLNHPFSAVTRIKLIMDIITNDDDDCCSMNLRKMRMDGGEKMLSSIITYYPLHDRAKADELAKIWFPWKVKPWEQPLDDVKDYVGEKIGLYFEFTAHYTTWLLPLAIAGILVCFDLMVEAILFDFDNALLGAYSLPFYCIFVSFWSQLMIEYWKRRQATKAMEWGMSNFEEQELERPEFLGQEMRSIVNGKPIKHFDVNEKAKRVAYSVVVVASLIGLVILLVSCIFGLQYYLQNDVDDASAQSGGNTGVSILSAVQIVLLGMFYTDTAIKLNDYENHRTDTEYDDALIGKLFAFNFVNSYASLFFIAFIKVNLEPCNGPCMVELAYQLAIIFATKLTIEKASNVISLMVSNYFKKMEEDKEMREAISEGREVREKSATENQAMFEEYDPSLGVLTDYSQIFIQFGFVTLFVAACPIAPFIAYLSNLIEIRSDGAKLLYLMMRPVPMGAEDIGTWLSILQLTAVISVVTNSGILCFTMDLLTFSGVGKIWTFIGFQYAIFIAMAVFAYLVDDVPYEVTIQLQRQEYLAERATMDEDDLEAERNKKSAGARPVRTQFDPAQFRPHDEDEKSEYEQPKDGH